MLERGEKLRQEANADSDEREAKTEKLRQEMEAQMQALREELQEELTPRPALTQE
jgi:hypothetical protein